MYCGRQLKFIEMLETRSEDYQEIQEDIVTIFVNFLDRKRSSECMLGPRAINESPSWLCETRSHVFSGLHYMMVAASRP